MKMKLMDFLDYFRSEEEVEQAQQLELIRELSAWLSCPYHAKFITWLKQQADRRVATTQLSHLDLVSAVARAEAFREVLARLEQLDREVKAAQALHREE